MSTISESIEARRWAGQTKRAILQRRWDIKKSAGTVPLHDHQKNQSFSPPLCKRQREKQLDGSRWVCVAAVSKRVESEVRSIEAALEGQRAALALEMALEKQALSNDTSGADEVHDACLGRR
jgi:hypothetical protein